MRHILSQCTVVWCVHQLSEIQVLSDKKAAHFRELLEGRIAELNRVLADAHQETQTLSTRSADPADQAASEYERQMLAHKIASTQQMVKTLTQALQRIQRETFGECAHCGGDISVKRLEALPWARYCVTCQELIEQ